MFHPFARLLAAATLVTAAAPTKADPYRFYRGNSIGGAATAEVRVADALHRSDGRWLILGSAFDDNLRERTYLNLREADGRLISSTALAPEAGKSCSARSLVAPSSDPAGAIVVACIEYDPFDAAAPTGLLLARFDEQLERVWSRRVAAPDLTFSTNFGGMRLVLPQGVDNGLWLIGKMQRLSGGKAQPADVFLTRIDPLDGELISPLAIGTLDGEEGGTDLQYSPSSQRFVLLTELQRSVDGAAQSGDGVLQLDAAGAVAVARLAGHPDNGILAKPLRLLASGTDWVVAGRLSWVDTDSFYLHRFDGNLVPAPARSVILFFNYMDMIAANGGYLLYGQSNDEEGESGTRLLQLNSDFSPAWQRRYGTENGRYPRGAMELGGDGALLLALSAFPEEKFLPHEAVSLVRKTDGIGVLCNESDSTTLSMMQEDVASLEDWAPVATALHIQSVESDAAAHTIEHSEIPLCTTIPEVIFRDGFEPASERTACTSLRGR